MNAAIDAVSLIFILKIPKLKPLVEQHFQKIYITTLVQQEVFETKISEELVPLNKLAPLFELKNPKKLLATKIGKGELAAISLALEEKIQFITEDRKATLFANSLDVKTTSVLSIIIKSKEDKTITSQEAKDIFFELVENGFYISPELFSAVLKTLEN